MKLRSFTTKVAPLALPGGPEGRFGCCACWDEAALLAQVHKVDALVSYKADAEG